MAVALKDYSLITKEELASYSGISTDDLATYEDVLHELLNNVADLLEHYVDRRLKQHGDDAAITEQLTVKGRGRKLFPRNYPIGAITTIHEDADWVWGAATLRDASDYRINEIRYGIVLKSAAVRFARGEELIKLVYTAGYGATGAPDVPEDLKLAAKQTAAYAMRQSFHKLGTGMLGRQQAGREGETVDWVENVDVPAPAKRILDRYRKVGIL